MGFWLEMELGVPITVEFTGARLYGTTEFQCDDSSMTIYGHNEATRQSSAPATTMPKYGHRESQAGRRLHTHTHAARFGHIYEWKMYFTLA